MHQKTLTELSDDLQHKRVSSCELTEHFLTRIRQWDSQLNSFITITDEQAMQQAQQADKLLASGNSHPLTGIPIAHKDIFCTTNIKTSAASKMLDNFISPYNATLIEQYNQAGMVMLGKTNMDEFAMGSSNEHSYYGPVHNPWQLDSVPGGSSGGSAAAVAARLAPAATGTDTGGSIRQPSAFCGLTGLKPTYGRVSRFGMIAFASSLDQAGVITQNAADAALLFNIMATHDPKDSTSLKQDPEDFTKNLNNSLKGLKIGLPKEYFDSTVDPAIATAIEQVAQQLQQQGATLHEVSLPHTHYAMSCYYIIAPAECSSNLSRYDGLRYGYRCDNPTSLEDCYRRSRSEAFGDEVQSRILTGTYVLSAGYYDAYYIKAQKVRRLIRDDFVNAYQQVDILLTPTTPTTAFKLGVNLDDTDMYSSDVFTTAVNLAGLPALSMCCGFNQGLPIGAQLIGPHLSESRLLNIAHQYQQQTNWHQQTPSPFNQDKA